MKIAGLVWVGTRTSNFEQMTAFCRDVMGLTSTRVNAGQAIFDMPNGDRLEIFDSDSTHNSFMTHPITGFLVDDLVAARAEMENQGIEFIGPIHDGSDGYAWSHFRAPDGFIYELTFAPAHLSS